MKTAIIVGATGLVGKELCKQLLADERYDKVKLLVRKSQAVTHPKIEEVIIDFNNLNALNITGDELYCCLGTTIKTAGSKEAFYKVDFEYVVQIAKKALHGGVKKVVVVSAMGANKNSSVFYNKVKGEMEGTVSQLGFQNCIIVRPSMLLGNRTEFRLAELIGKKVMTALSFLIPAKYKAIHDYQVANAMVFYCNNTQQKTLIVENQDMLV